MVFLVDTNTRIRNGKLYASISSTLPDFQLYLAFFRELERVLHQLVQDFLQRYLVGTQGKVLIEHVLIVELQVSVVDNRCAVDNLLAQLVDIDIVVTLIVLPALILSHLQQFVDKVGNLDSILTDVVDHGVTLLLLQLVVRVGNHLCKTCDDIQRSAYLVAHLFDKRGLHAIRLFGAIQSNLQFFILLQQPLLIATFLQIT